MKPSDRPGVPVKLHLASADDGRREFDLLLASLDGLLAQLRRLDGLATDKLGAMRAADAKALEACAREEGEVLESVLAQGPHRGAVLAAVAQRVLGMSSSPPTLPELCKRLPEPGASILRAKTRALEVVTTELQRKNRLAGEVARRLHSHIRGIFADVAKAAQPEVGYGPRNTNLPTGASCYVEAIG